MRKMLLFLVVFFIFDRIMNYKMNHATKKCRIIAQSEKTHSGVLLSERKERTSDEHKRVFMAHNKNKNYFNSLNWLKLPYSSNRNV